MRFELFVECQTATCDYSAPDGFLCTNLFPISRKSARTHKTEGPL